MGEEPPSPCIRICTLDPDDICLGCGRTIDEICGWSAADAAAKRAILAAATERLAEHAARWGRSV